MTDDRFLLKDLFNEETLGIVAAAVVEAEPSFDATGYLAAVFDDAWADRELKQRMRHAATTLGPFLPEDYRTALDVLVRAAPATAAAGFAAMVLSDFVEIYGLDDFDASVPALAVFTLQVSAEFAVRPFLLRYPERMVAQLKRWTADADPRVRRLASEGSRPRLPWGVALRPLRADPDPILPILAALRHDPSADVRRSVANSLNDITKDHADLVVELLTAWSDGTTEVAEITTHALRTLVKRGHAGALALLGYPPDPHVEVAELTVEPATVEVGGGTRLRFTIVATGDVPQRLVIDAVVFYARSGSGTSSKVYKLKTAEVRPGEKLLVDRKISLRPRSTRRIHPGPHAVEVQVNGARRGRVEFEVFEPRTAGPDIDAT